MPDTYDPTTNFGKTRLLCQDTDITLPIFHDNEIQAFLDLNNQSPRLAAAQALEVIAMSEVYIQKRIKSLDLETNGATEANAIQALAKELRRQEYEGDGDMAGFFDFAEGVYNQFGMRERMIKQYLREQG